MNRLMNLKLTRIGTIIFVIIAGVLTPSLTGAISGQSGKARLNVLFIAVDDLRPELGCYGHPVVKSPNIDRLASRGLLFNRAYCQQAVCNPSRASLMTGLRPETLNVLDLPTHFRDQKPNAVTIAQHFKQNGYHTQAFGKIFHTAHGNRDDALSWSVKSLTPQAINSNLTREKPTTQQKEETTKKDPLRIGNSSKPPYAAPDVADNQLQDGMIAERAIETLRQVKDKPFFLAVGFLKPHLPFIAPKKYWDLYSPDQIKLPANRFHPKNAPTYASNNSGELRTYSDMPKTGPVSDEVARKLIHGYYASVSYMDAQVGKVLAELDKLGLRDKTIVILWGDHGWQLGEHDTWAKHTAWETATRAPLIISVPRQKTVGQKSNSLVEFVDIFPSLAELCGLPMLEELEGISFVPLLKEPQREWKKAAFSLWPKKIPNVGDGMGRAIRTDRYRLVEWSVPQKTDFREYELYDHQADPQENESIANKPENKKLVEELTKQLHAGWPAALPKGISNLNSRIKDD